MSNLQHEIDIAVKSLQYKKVYFDTNPIIYFLEGSPAFANIVVSIFQAKQTLEFKAITGDLTLTELLVKPIKDNNLKLKQQVKSLFDHDFIHLVEHQRSIFELCGELRAFHSLKIPDALHVATTIYYQADIFITADHKLANKNIGITFLDLNEFKQ